MYAVRAHRRTSEKSPFWKFEQAFAARNLVAFDALASLAVSLWGSAAAPGATRRFEVKPLEIQSNDQIVHRWPLSKKNRSPRARIGDHARLRPRCSPRSSGARSRRSNGKPRANRVSGAAAAAGRCSKAASDSPRAPTPSATGPTADWCANARAFSSGATVLTPSRPPNSNQPQRKSAPSAAAAPVLQGPDHASLNSRSSGASGGCYSSLPDAAA